MFEEPVNSTPTAEEHASGAAAAHAENPGSPVSEDVSPREYLERRNEEVEVKKNGVQKRFNKLTAEKHHLRSQNEELRSRLDAIEARLTPVERTELEAGRSHEDRENFAANSEDTERESRGRGSEEAQRATQDEYQRREDYRQQEVQGRYQARLGKLIESRPELWEKSTQINIHPALLEVIKPALHELDNGPEVTTHLIENPREVHKLHTMGPAAAIAYIGRLSAKLEIPKEKIVSKAEAPIQPVVGTIRSTVSLEDMSPSDYQRIRNTQIERRNR